MKESDRYILLILDNTPSHITNTLTLTNIEVLFLPPNVTSKIQPMDSGIITSFKLHYRRMQLQNAIDRDEAGERDIYKVDQLQGMRWTEVAWGEISTETIKNCWSHTKIISPRDEAGIPIVSSSVCSIEDIEENLLIDPNDEFAVKELQQQLNILHIRNPIPIKDLLNLEEEREAHQEFTDEDLIQTAMEIEQVEDEIIIPPLTGKEQLDILRGALRIVNERIDDGGATMKILRKLQSRIREEVRKEKAENQIQYTLEQFFLIPE